MTLFLNPRVRLQRLLEGAPGALLHLGIAGTLVGAAAAAATSQEPTVPVPLSFEHPRGAALALTAKEVHELTVAELTTQVGDGEAVKRPAALKLLSRTDALILDEYAGDGPFGTAPIRRRYDALEGSLVLSDPAQTDKTLGGMEMKIGSALAGLSVLFTPAATQPGGFGRMYDSAVSKESHLAKLSAPVDWSQFVPPVANPGESWSIPLHMLQPLIAPSGYLGWTFAKPEVGAVSRDQARMERAFSLGLAGNLQVPFGGTLTGEPATARVATVGLDSEQGPVAQILIEYEFSMSQRTLEKGIESTEDEAVAGLEIVGTELEVTLKGTAIVSWALDYQRPFGALVEADESVTSTVRARAEGSAVASETVRMEGRLLNGLTWRERPLLPLSNPPVVVPAAADGGGR